MTGSPCSEAPEKGPDQRLGGPRLALLLSKSRSQNGPENWDEAWSLAQLPEGAEDVPEERLTRALVLTRNPETDRQDEGLALLAALVDDLPPTNNVAAAARQILTQTYTARGDTAKLLDLTALSAANGNSPESIALYAEVLLREGKTAEARHQLERLETTAAKNPLTAQVRALILKSEGKLTAAADALEAAFDAHRDDPDGGRNVGRALVAMLGGVGGGQEPVIPNQHATAERLARKVADAWPATSWMLGRILARQGKIGPAVDACLAAVRADDAEAKDIREAAGVAIGLATAPTASEAVRDKADAVITQARESDPDDADLMIYEAFLRHAQGRVEDEVALYEAARTRSPSNDLYLNNLAWNLALVLDRPEEALEVIDALIASRGEQATLLDTRGMVLVALGRPEEAVHDLEKAVKSNPGNAVYQYHLARAYLKAGQEDQFRTQRDLAKKYGLAPEQLEPIERDEMKELLKR